MKKDPLSKVQQIEEQIKKLQEKQKQYIEKAQKEIGRYLMETWDIEDVDQAKLLIEKAKKCFDESKQEEVDEKEASDQRYTEAH